MDNKASITFSIIDDALKYFKQKTQNAFSNNG